MDRDEVGISTVPPSRVTGNPWTIAKVVERRTGFMLPRRAEDEPFYLFVTRTTLMLDDPFLTL